MLYFFILGVLLLIAIGALLTAASSTDRDAQFASKLVTVLAFVFIIPVTLWSCFHTIDYGHVGLVKTFGAITGQTGSGLVFTAPWQDVDFSSH